MASGMSQITFYRIERTGMSMFDCVERVQLVLPHDVQHCLEFMIYGKMYWMDRVINDSRHCSYAEDKMSIGLEHRMIMKIYTIFIVDYVINIGYGIGSECGERIKGNVLDFCVWFKVMVMALTAHTPHSAML